VFFKDEAQPGTSKILTPTGYQTMADMVVGSRVIGEDGLAHNVTQVKDCGVYDIYRVTFNDGTFVECSPGHLWTMTHSRPGEAFTLSALDIAKNLHTRKYIVPTHAPVIFDEDFQPDEELFLQSRGGCTREVVGVTAVGRGPVRCISVDAPYGLYLTDHCIVTHNSAHYKYAEMVEAALSDNALIQVDISSVGAPGNVFHRRRESGVDWTPERREYPKSQVRVFVMDWSDHPAKTQEWYEGRKKKATEEGLLHVFAQEIDRDYSASIEGVVINSEWVRSAVDAHLKLGFDDSGGWIAGLDVADEGGDTTALAIRKGVILREVREWGDRDTGVSTRTAVAALRDKCPVDLQYDSVGMGAGIKAEGNRLFLEKKIPKGLRFVPWNAGAQVLFKDRRVVPGDKNSPKNGDFYLNLKAQAWWNLARRFERTYRALNDPGFTFDVDDLISLPSSLPLIQKIIKELSQPTASYNSRMKLVIDKRPDGMRSPNLADAIVMAYWPITAGKPMKITPEILARAAVPMRRNPFPAAFSTNYGGRRR
jgi:hypothetical protein